MKFHFSIAAWGDAFLEILGDIHLPSLSSPGNLPAFLEKFPLEYRLYTTPEDAEKLDRLKGLLDFRRRVPTRVIAVPGLDLSDVHHSHRVFNDLMRMAMRDAQAEGAHLLMNNPDTCWGDGSLRHLAGLIASGKRAILNSAIRVDSRVFMAAARERFPLAPGGAMTIANRELVKLGWECIHPHQASTVWGQRNANLMPSPLITPVRGQGYIVNMPHLGSLCVMSEHLDEGFQQTTDGDYVNRIVDDYSAIHVPSDSDDFCVMELSDPRRYVQNIIAGEPLNEVHLARYLLDTASWGTFSLQNFRRPLRYHWGTLDEGVWRRAEDEVTDRVEAVLNRRQLLSWGAGVGHESEYRNLSNFLTRFFSNPTRCRRVEPCRRRLFLVPDLTDWRAALRDWAEPGGGDPAGLEAMIQSLVFDEPGQVRPGKGSAAVAWNGRKVFLAGADLQAIRSVDGVAVRRTVGLEDGSILFLAPGFKLAEGASDRASRRLGREASAGHTLKFSQRRLLAGALWKSVLAASHGEPRKQLIARFLAAYGKRLLRLVTAARGRIRTAILLAEARLSTVWSFWTPRLDMPLGSRQWNRMALGIEERLGRCRWESLTPHEWGEVLKSLRGSMVAVDRDIIDDCLGRHGHGAAAPGAGEGRENDIDLLLHVALHAVGRTYADLARNSEIYYELGLTLRSAGFLAEAAICFSACAFLSPGFDPPLEKLDAIEEVVIGGGDVLKAKVAEI